MTIRELNTMVDKRQEEFHMLRAMAWLGFPVSLRTAEREMWQAIRWLRRATC